MTVARIAELMKAPEPIYIRLHWFMPWRTIACPKCKSPKFKQKRLTNMQTYQLYGYCSCGWKWVGSEHPEPWDT